MSWGVCNMAKKTIEQQLADMLLDFPADDLTRFLKDIIPLFELYDVEDESDWVEQEVGSEAVNNVRVLRTFYLISRIADFHSGMLVRIKMRHYGLWEKMEKAAKTHEKKHV